MTSSSNHTFPILNPNVYLNYLPPETANQFEVTRNIYLATVGALIWDMLASDSIASFKIGGARIWSTIRHFENPSHAELSRHVLEVLIYLLETYLSHENKID
ncbi:hypothetical protein BDQ12DRAFT_667878 [Crucibulum laeve]|uniref:Uncharacterized protein n=1 Tax=Crucibulum laeve TaxID=68775 RepID=A0A5C3LX45_9AGAR|nr:hypothetical protein BDQ12DRAFT_667878 [Crucibulum laeve]